jgi:hypothetical protein
MNKPGPLWAACSAAIPVRCKWLIPMAAEQAA